MRNFYDQDILQTSSKYSGDQQIFAGYIFVKHVIFKLLRYFNIIFTSF